MKTEFFEQRISGYRFIFEISGNNCAVYIGGKLHKRINVPATSDEEKLELATSYIQWTFKR